MSDLSAFQFDESVASLTSAMLSRMKPTPRLSVSEIARRHLILSPEYSKLAGPVNLDLFPFLIEPMDALTPGNGVRTVVFQGPVQSGKTIILQAFLVSRIGFYPGPFLWVTSHDTKAEEFSKNRLDLMIRDSELLRGLVADDKARDKNNTIKLKRFPGGTIKLVGAQSVSGLTSDTIRDAAIDESDDHRENVSGAGSSIELTMNRQTQFGDMAKTAIVSSPKLAGASEVEQWRVRGTDRRFMVPCPKCGHMQALEPCNADFRDWRLVWERGRYDDVRYLCENDECDHRWSNAEKNLFLPRGQWSAPRNGLADGSIESYLLNFMYLPLGTYSWEDFARAWDAAVDRQKAGDLDPMRTLVNTRMARTWVDRGESMGAHELSQRVEPSSEFVPDWVELITAFTDVQGGNLDPRLETMWVGWGPGEESIILDYIVTPGFIGRDTWDELDKLRRRRWQRENGEEVPVWGCGVDCGFEMSKVLAYTTPRRNQRPRVLAMKGVEGTPRDAIVTQIASRAKAKRANNAPYTPVRTVPNKDKVHALLQTRTPGPRFVHIPDFIPEKHPVFFEGLTEEHRLQTRDKSGKLHVRWLKKRDHAPNEPWDCLCGNHAVRLMAELQGFKFSPMVVAPMVADATEAAAVSAEIFQNPQTVQISKRPPRERRPRSNWMDGGLGSWPGR